MVGNITRYLAFCHSLDFSNPQRLRQNSKKGLLYLLGRSCDFDPRRTSEKKASETPKVEENDVSTTDSVSCQLIDNSIMSKSNFKSKTVNRFRHKKL